MRRPARTGFELWPRSARKIRRQAVDHRHPLFPATVALWFGTLFGIGSLAIRPSLIDGLIVSVGIDAIIPAAAPPMGVTTRILLALALAAIGGTLGAWLARRIAAPKAASAPRKRGAASAVAASSERARSTKSAGSRRGRLALADEGKPRRDYVNSARCRAMPISSTFRSSTSTASRRRNPKGPNPSSLFSTASPKSSAVATHWTPEPGARAVPQDAQVFQPVASEPEIVRQPAPPREPAQIFVREEMSQPEAPATAQTPGAEDAPPFSRSSGLAATQLAAAHCDQPGGLGPPRRSSRLLRRSRPRSRRRPTALQLPRRWTTRPSRDRGPRSFCSPVRRGCTRRRARRPRTFQRAGHRRSRTGRRCDSNSNGVPWPQFSAGGRSGPAGASRWRA